jgi:pyruvate/2-oxoglutarate/acetoin dehydrogenase E1 component
MYEGIEAEVVDFRTIKPLDAETVCRSVAKATARSREVRRAEPSGVSLRLLRLQH